MRRPCACSAMHGSGWVERSLKPFDIFFRDARMYKLCFYVPATHLEQVKTAVFKAGAGRIGNYDCCAWQTLGQGQFRPDAQANPFIGKSGELETVVEYKVELVCSDELISAALSALKHAHPYEEPAYDVIKLIDIL